MVYLVLTRGDLWTISVIHTTEKLLIIEQSFILVIATTIISLNSTGRIQSITNFVVNGKPFTVVGDRNINLWYLVTSMSSARLNRGLDKQL
jgi:hypothetical protein